MTLYALRVRHPNGTRETFRQVEIDKPQYAIRRLREELHSLANEWSCDVERLTVLSFKQLSWPEARPMPKAIRKRNEYS